MRLNLLLRASVMLTIFRIEAQVLGARCARRIDPQPESGGTIPQRFYFDLQPTGQTTRLPAGRIEPSSAT